MLDFRKSIATFVAAASAVGLSGIAPAAFAAEDIKSGAWAGSTLNADCGGDVCARNGECVPARDVYAVKVTWTIRNSSGAVVLTHLDNASLAAGTHSWVFDGRGPGGTMLPIGSYTSYVMATDGTFVYAQTAKPPTRPQMAPRRVAPTGRRTVGHRRSGDEASS